MMGFCARTVATFVALQVMLNPSLSEVESVTKRSTKLLSQELLLDLLSPCCGVNQSGSLWIRAADATQETEYLPSRHVELQAVT